MPKQIGIVMDAIEDIKIAKDSSFAMLLSAQQRGWDIHYMQQQDLYSSADGAFANSSQIKVFDNPDKWFEVDSKTTINLSDLDVILMRKDPPFDMEYITTTYILEIAQNAGALIVNPTSSLRDFNEKMFITLFPQCCTPFLISRNQHKIKQFINTHEDVILKPLDGMGGASIFRIQQNDSNLPVILETITQHGSKTVMAQLFIPEIKQGDKRVLLINGEPIPYALARIPAEGEIRGNLAAGASAKGQELSEKDRWICQQIAPTLKEHGILFAGIDIIGDYLTEINITSPTCIRELDALYDLDIASQLLDCIENKLLN